MTRAVVAVDVDGVLAPDPRVCGGEDLLASYGYRPHRFEWLSPDGEPGAGTVWLNPAHGVWLGDVADRGAELVWATSWGPVASQVIAPALGLPAMPVLDVPGGGARFGWSAKTGPIRAFAQGRPLAWIDDSFGGKEFGWAQDRCEDGVPTLMVPVQAGHGLRRDHVLAVTDWLDTEVAAAS